jgi:hypothetical protein
MDALTFFVLCYVVGGAEFPLGRAGIRELGAVWKSVPACWFLRFGELCGILRPGMGILRALLLQNAPAPPGDEAGAMDLVCAPMSPIPLAFMEPGGFDETDSLLLWFEDSYSS